MFMVINFLAMGYACLQVYQFRGFGSRCDEVTLVGYLALANVSSSLTCVSYVIWVWLNLCVVVVLRLTAVNFLLMEWLLQSGPTVRVLHFSCQCHEVYSVINHMCVYPYAWICHDTHIHTHKHTHTHTHTHTHAHTQTGSCTFHLYVCICLLVVVYLRWVWLEDLRLGGLQPRNEMYGKQAHIFFSYKCCI